MAQDRESTGEDLYLGTTEEPTPRLRAALEELASAYAEAETGEVSGYEFGSEMSLGLSPSVNDLAFGVKLGPIEIDGGDRCGGGGFVKCRKSYTVTTAPSG